LIVRDKKIEESYQKLKSPYPESLTLHNPTAYNKTQPETIMANNPVASPLNEREPEELPNRTEHVYVNDQEPMTPVKEEPACQVYVSKKHPHKYQHLNTSFEND